MTDDTSPHGSKMDRIVPSRPLARILPLAAFGAFALAATAAWYLGDGAETVEADAERLSVVSVRTGAFDDSILVRATVVPAETVFLDLLSGGRIRSVEVENGTIVEQGQALVSLDNTALQLQVMSREAEVSEQLSRLRDTRLAFATRQLELERQLLDLGYRVERLERQTQQQEKLFAAGLVAEEDLISTRNQLAQARATSNLVRRRHQLEDQSQNRQIEDLEASSTRLLQNLELARRSLDELDVTAPASGLLRGFDAETGASLAPGDRLGQIDSLEGHEIRALVDEVHVARVHEGQRARLALDGKHHELRVTRVTPQVENGVFAVDLEFEQDLRQRTLRAGQSVRLELVLGETTRTILLPRGAFFEQTGGRWVFVVDHESGQAQRRDIQLGRRNTDYFEVLSGLEENDSVIISDYQPFADAERLLIRKGPS